MNVERDAAQGGSAGRYLVTPTAVRTIDAVVSELCAGRGGAWTITGPFGTGKSAFALFLSELLHASDAAARKRAAVALASSDAGNARLEAWTGSALPRYLPVLCSGTREPLSAGLVRSLAASVTAARHKLPSNIASRLRRAERLAAASSPLESKALIDLVEDVAASIASGRSKAAGLLLIMDELGKALEYAVAKPETSDVFLLQQLAEMASRSGGAVAFIGVLHQDFRAYAHGLPPVDRAEWEKIRGRFVDIVFEEPAEQLLRFVAMAWAGIRTDRGMSCSKAVVSATKASAARLWEHGLAPQGLRIKDDGELLAEAAPMHPLVASLLGPLFRRFGQNERSAFGFLQSEEPSGVLAFCRRPASDGRLLYDAVDLYDYLRASLGATLLHTPDAKRWAEAFETEARLPTLSGDAVVVLRAVALLGIVSRWYPARASHEILAFALSDRLDTRRIEASLQELQKARAIVHRRYNDSFVVWEGSDVDVAARLEEARSRLGQTTAAATLLRRHAGLRPVLARRHSFEKGTLRFFDVTFESWSESGPSNPLDQDGRIVILLGATKRGRADRTRRGPRTLYCVPEDAGRLDELALELAALDWVRRNTHELNTDSAGRRELHARRLEVERLLDLTLDRLLRTDVAGCAWYLDGKAVSVAGPRGLNELLSRISDDTFHAAPPMDCELLNRKELSSAAAKARGMLLAAMIEKSGEAELGLVDGDPPERSMYRSILSDKGGLGLHTPRRSGEAGFVCPRGGGGQAVYAALDAVLAEAGEERVGLDRLFAVLAAPPFGLREGVLPVLVFAYLLANESDLAIYNEGVFCREWSGALAAQAVKSPSQLAVRRLQVKGVRARVFEELARALALSEQPDGASGKVLAAVRPLMRFTAQLPEHARLTQNLSDRTLAVREALVKATEPELLLFCELPQACGLQPFRSGGRRRDGDVAEFVKAIKEAVAELRGALPGLLDESESAIKSAFGLPDDEGAFAVLLKRADAISEWAVEPDLKMLVQRVRAGGGIASDTVYGIASLMAERPVDKWRDDDRPKFAVRLRQLARRFAMLESTVVAPNHGADRQRPALRVALVGPGGAQIDRTLHLSDTQYKKAAAIEAKLRKSLAKEQDSVMVLAALCGLLAEFDGLDSSQRKGAQT